MKAVNDYIVVDKEKIGPKKIGGLILTEDLDENNRYIKATIISTGNLIEGLKGGDVVSIMTNMLAMESPGKIQCTK